MAAQYQCITYCSLPFNGTGWPLSCVSVLAGFRENGLEATLVLPRASAPVPPTIDVVAGLQFPFSRMPWRFVSGMGAVGLERRFARLLDRAEPRSTVAYFWPGAPVDLVRRARERGIITVREMINSYQGTAKVILDDAYQRAGLPPTHTVSQQNVDAEQAELAEYDFLFASNSRVEESLRAAGISDDRVLRSSFGWSPKRFAREGATSAQRRTENTVFLFVGSVSVRKGIPELLAAWGASDVQGELVLVGDVEPALTDALHAAVATGTVRHVPYTSDIGAYYRMADVFVFPTLEEGGPQVTLEAAGCGLPVITTSMGASRLIEDGVNGLIVDEGDTVGLAHAIATLAGDSELRKRMATHAAHDAVAFDYDVVSASRAGVLRSLLAQRS